MPAPTIVPRPLLLRRLNRRLAPLGWAVRWARVLYERHRLGDYYVAERARGKAVIRWV